MSCSEKSSTLDVLLVMRACVAQYPPTVNQARQISASGLKTGLVHLSSPSHTVDGLGLTRQWEPHRVWNSKTEPSLSLWTRVKNSWAFANALHEVIRQNRPKVIIAYDPAAIAQIRPALRRFRTIFHFHELPEAEPGMGVGTRLALRKAQRHARGADLVVFSDAMRARDYQAQVCLRTEPWVVKNCPARMDSVPASPLATLLRDSGLPSSQVVCYLGTVGVNQGLIEGAQSMRYWPEKSVFVLVGPILEGVRAEMMAEVGPAADRILFLGPKRHPEALALAAGAHVGLSLIQPNTRNWLHSAGAINKRFEYMALGLPQVTNAGPGVAELVAQNGCGLCVDPTAPEAIGEAVRSLLINPDRQRQMGARARGLHLSSLNYEAEFKPVLDWLSARIVQYPVDTNS